MVKMVAQRLHYHPDDGKEYKAGETFHVANERDAERLERRHKAMRATEAAKPAHVDPPKKARPEVVEVDETPKPKRAYLRRDMTAEETTAVRPMSYPGPTGEDEPSQS